MVAGRERVIFAAAVGEPVLAVVAAVRLVGADARFDDALYTTLLELRLDLGVEVEVVGVAALFDGVGTTLAQERLGLVATVAETLFADAGADEGLAVPRLTLGEAAQGAKGLGHHPILEAATAGMREREGFALEVEKDDGRTIAATDDKHHTALGGDEGVDAVNEGWIGLEDRTGPIDGAGGAAVHELGDHDAVHVGRLLYELVDLVGETIAFLRGQDRQTFLQSEPSCFHGAGGKYQVLTLIQDPQFRPFHADLRDERMAYFDRNDKVLKGWYTRVTMNQTSAGMSKWQDRKSLALLVLRVFVGGIFMYHGWGKLLGPMPGIPGFTGMLSGMGVPAPMVMAYVVALIELLGGLLMILGVKVRLVAGLQACVMLVAIFVAKKMAWPMIELDVALLGILVSLMLSGAGKLALMPGSACDCGCGCGNGDCGAAGKDGCCDHEHDEEMKK